MASITIKNIPDVLYEKLRITANLHRRSINSEMINCLERITSHRLNNSGIILCANQLLAAESFNLQAVSFSL